MAAAAAAARTQVDGRGGEDGLRQRDGTEDGWGGGGGFFQRCGWGGATSARGMAERRAWEGGGGFA